MKIFAMGDISFGDQPLCFGFGTMSTGAERGYEYLFSSVASLWSENDIVFANLEAVIDLEKHDPSLGFKQSVNRGLKVAAAALKEAGINVVSLANNHVLDHGKEAIRRTIDNLEFQGIDHVGSSYRRQHIVYGNGASIGFLAWSFIPQGSQIQDPRQFYNFTSDPDEIIKDVRNLNPRVDHLVLSLHWGNEFMNVPSPKQVQIAHDLVDAGVDILVGHHPHVLQPMENYKNSVIFYSLGNFVFDHWMYKCNLSVVVEIDLNNIQNFKLHPIRIGKNFAPNPARDRKDIELIEASLKVSGDLFLDRYEDHVYRKRFAYRLSAIWHVVRNLNRLMKKKSWPFWHWLLDRSIFIISISHKERREPNSVYLRK